VLTPDITQEQKEEYVTHVRSSINQGNYLIKILLEAQNVDNPSFQPVVTRVDVWSFVHDFQVDVSGELLKKQQQLLIDVEDEGRILSTDKQMLTRILDNLISNASKFSEKGKTIYLRVWSSNEHILFSVRDQGPGISEDDQQKMFKKFQQLTARPTAGERSTGLGLSITKVLVDKLNGMIEVKSRLGEGTEFVVGLPV
jgi:K+-sensing histidine kinase KdpD